MSSFETHLDDLHTISADLPVVPRAAPELYEGSSQSPSEDGGLKPKSGKSISGDEEQPKAKNPKSPKATGCWEIVGQTNSWT